MIDFNKESYNIIQNGNQNSILQKNTITVDSCVFAKLFLNEDDKEEARIFFKEIAKQDYLILVPSVFIYEVYYIGQKFCVNIDYITDLLDSYQGYGLKVLELNKAMTTQTIEIIKNTSHPKAGFPAFYDSSYHAIAIQNNCNFITADKKYYNKTKHLGHIKLLSEVTL